MKKFFCIVFVCFLLTGCSIYRLKSGNYVDYDDHGSKVDKKIEYNDYILYLRSKTAAMHKGSMYYLPLWVAYKNTTDKSIFFDPGMSYIEFGDERIYHITHSRTEISGSGYLISNMWNPQNIEPSARIKNC